MHTRPNWQWGQKQCDESQGEGEAQIEEKARAATGPEQNGEVLQIGREMGNEDNGWEVGKHHTDHNKEGDMRRATHQGGTKAADRATSPQKGMAKRQIIEVQTHFFSLLLEPKIN
jgi:hypothetical protein